MKFMDLIRHTSLPVLADGAMGTLLHTRGASFELCFDELNLKNPALVADVHLEYIQAGSQVILTNTFGANRFKLAEHNLQDRVGEINRAGVELAKRAVAASFKDVYIAGDIGPLGVRLAPFGRVQPEQARQAFAEQAQALADAGVDLIVIETMSDIYEVGEAIAGVRQVCDLPAAATMTFTRDDTTLLGDTPGNVARKLAEYGAEIVGINCSGGPAQALRILKQMQKAAPGVYLAVKPNAGWPEQVGGRIMYPAGPAYFAEYAQAFCQLGVRMVGGCCGTTPQHIQAMRAALSAECPDLSSLAISSGESLEDAQLTGEVAPSQLSQKLSSGEFVVAVEMDPPRGLSAHKLLAGASLLAEAGADVIDVADSPMARMRMSAWAVCSLIQRKVGIETTLHFPTRGRNLLRVQGDLLAAHALDIRNVFVVMGDPTAIGDYPNAMDNYDLVPSGLIKLIKQSFNAGLDHAGVTIGQPTSFFVGCALDLTPQDPGREAKNLRRKLEAGADFILSQPVYEPAKARQFLSYYAEHYGRLKAPLLVGVLPLFGARHAAFLHHEVPGISIPHEMMRRIQMGGEEAPREGVRIAAELAEELREFANGLYIMPAFGRYDLAAELIEAVK